MEHLAWADSRAAVALYHALVTALIVLAATTVLGAIIVWTIEGLQSTARNIRSWIKKPTLGA